MPRAPSGRPLPVERSLEALLALWDELRAAPGPHAFVLRGTSMWPAAPDGSIVEVRPCASRELRPGDLVTFRRGDTIVTHRVVRVSEGGWVHAWGDAVVIPDAPVAPADVLGRATVVRRGALRARSPVPTALRRLAAAARRALARSGQGVSVIFRSKSP